MDHQQDNNDDAPPAQQASLRSKLVRTVTGRLELQSDDGSSMSSTQTPNLNSEFSNSDATRKKASVTTVGGQSSYSIGGSRNNKNNNIINPQSWISRNPDEISQSLSLPLKEVHTIRARVAECITMDQIVGHGMGCRQIREELNRIRCNNISSREDLHTRQSVDRPLPFISAASTALDLSLHAKEFKSNVRRVEEGIIHTGSNTLDYLLCPNSTTVSSKDQMMTSGMKRKRQSAQSSTSISSSSSSAILPGLPSGIVTEVAGSSGSGKTQLALSLAVNAILRSPSSSSSPWKVHYFTAGGGNTSLPSLARRFRQICHSRLVTTKDGRTITTEDPRASDNSVFERISFLVVENGYHLLAALTQLEEEMESGSSDGEEGEDDDGRVYYNRLIVLDSASGCLGPYLYGDGDGGVGAALMNDVCLSLRRLARRRSVVGRRRSVWQNSVFVTNGVVSASSSSSSSSGMDGNSSHLRRQHQQLEHQHQNQNHQKPALGDSWRAADVQLLLTPIGDVYDESSSSSSSPPHNTKPPIKSRKSIRRRVDARLLKHYAKRCSNGREGLLGVRFGIDCSGIIDDNDDDGIPSSREGSN